TQVGTMNIDNGFGNGFTKAFVPVFKGMGGTITSTVVYPGGQASYSDQLTAIYAAKPQAILLAGYPPDGALIIQNYDSKFVAQGTFWFFGDALVDDSFVTLVGGNNFTFDHEGIGPGTPMTPEHQFFEDTFKKQYGEASKTNSYGQNIWDGVYLLALAISSA